MKIVMITSEAQPFAKTGGLADVLFSLPKALANAGHEVTVILPFHKTINAKNFNIESTDNHVSVSIDGKKRNAAIHCVRLKEGINVILLKNKEYFDRKGLYQDRNGDYPDNAERFAFFARAAIDTILTMKLKPEAIHAHDWQAALALYHARTTFKNNPDLKKTKLILTIHNIGYQGIFPAKVLKGIGFGPEDFSIKTLEFYGKVNFLKGGIIAADAITTVSKSHADEILTKQYGFGLEGVLKERKKDLHGIVNGLDGDIWNPATDHFIAANFTQSDLSGKEACKSDLQKKLGLHIKNSVPLVGSIGRLTSQKGIDLLIEALPEIMERKTQLVVLGTGEAKYHKLLKSAAKDYHLNMRLILDFDEELAHQIEAGSDFFLMPSIYEPCGINQMISMKYGTIPIVRATGGLDDTVQKFNSITWKGTGFKFNEAKPQALASCFIEALHTWEQPVLRNKLIKNAMKSDFSWDKIAKEYLEVYRSA